MRKIILLSFILVSLIPVTLCGQDNFFTISPSGNWVAKDLTSYVVVPKEGLTASQLFTMVQTNVGKVYRSPKDIMSVVENKSISLRPYSEVAGLNSFMGIVDYFGGYYNLFFEFKDGKIRISAPVFEDKTPSGFKYYSNMKNAFNKKGEPKNNKSKKLVEGIQSAINYFISSLIKTEEPANDNW